MGRVVAISGGDLLNTEKLNLFALKLSGNDSPHVLFIGTASMDSEGYFEGIKAAFEKLNCSVRELPLTRGELDQAEIDARLEWADVIYVGGGDTRTMMKIWKQYSLDKKLKEIYENDTAVLTGLSAGAICWFMAGYSDSFTDVDESEDSIEAVDESEDSIADVNESVCNMADADVRECGIPDVKGIKYGIAKGMLGFFPYCFCPHYNEEGRETFDSMITDTKYDGLALENETAFVEASGKHFIIGSRDGAQAWSFSNSKKRKLEVRYL